MKLEKRIRILIIVLLLASILTAGCLVRDKPTSPYIIDEQNNSSIISIKLSSVYQVNTDALMQGLREVERNHTVKQVIQRTSYVSAEGVSPGIYITAYDVIIERNQINCESK